jgi:superfamily II DNA/RNA helicase
MSEVRHDTAMAKVPAVIDHVLAIDQPCVVFAHHHDVMAALAGGLKADGRSVVMLHGAHTSEQRQQAVDDFQQGRADVFIGGLKSAGVGITLTRASIAVFSELDWTPAVVTQAEDRIHRIGQNDAVLCQHLVIDRSLDHRIVELLVEKQGVISAVMKQHSKREIAKIAQRVTLEGIAGHLYVKRGPDYNDEYLGKVDPSGIFYPSRDCTNADCDRLREIAADFQGQLEAHGIDTGVCGCCGRELTNPESVRLGIGPFCRQRFGF